MRLKNKVAIITGAGSGIGRACAFLFAREGAKVVLVARNEGRLAKTCEEVGRDRATHVAADVSRREDIDRIVEVALRRFNQIHVLVNSAAALIPGTAESQTEEEWDTTFNTNVRGLWMLSKAVIPQMRQAGSGSIINIASALGIMGARNRAAYGASKGAVIALTKCMAMDLGADKIRVNAICPGIVETDMVAEFIDKAPDPEEARRTRLGLHPIGRFGQPEDIASCALFLASDESSWATGAEFPVDGGYTAGKI